MGDELEQEDVVAPGLVPPPPPPAAPGAEIDPRERFGKFLQAQAARREAMQRPEYQSTLRDDRLDTARGGREAGFGALLMNSAAQFGNIGGKTPDMSAYRDFAQNLAKGNQDYAAGIRADEDAMAKNDDRQTLLYKYLADQQRQKEMDAVARMQAETRARLAGRSKWETLHAKDPQGYPLERDSLTGETRRVPGAAPELAKPDKVTYTVGSGITDESGAPLMVGNNGTTKPIPGAVLKAKEKDAPKVPAGTAVDIGGYSGLDAAIDTLGESFDKLAGPKDRMGRFGSWLGQAVPGTTSDAAKYNQEARRAAQAIGTVLEKGKLTDADYEAKYLPMMPKWGDSEEVKQAKLRGLKIFARQKQKAELDGLTQAGYDTSNFAALPDLPPEGKVAETGAGTATAAPGGQAQGLLPHQDDDKAIAWAKAHLNPSDPLYTKAKAIMDANPGR